MRCLGSSPIEVYFGRFFFKCDGYIHHLVKGHLYARLCLSKLILACNSKALHTIALVSFYRYLLLGVFRHLVDARS